MGTSDEAEKLFELYWDLRKTLEERLANEATELGLTPPEFLVVRDALEHPGTTMMDLCIRTGLTKSSASRLVDGLVRRNLLLRTVPIDNRRCVELTVSAGFLTRKSCINTAVERLFHGYDRGKLSLLWNALNDLLSKDAVSKE